MWPRAFAGLQGKIPGLVGRSVTGGSSVSEWFQDARLINSY